MSKYDPCAGAVRSVRVHGGQPVRAQHLRRRRPRQPQHRDASAAPRRARRRTRAHTRQDTGAHTHTQTRTHTRTHIRTHTRAHAHARNHASAKTKY